MTQSSSPMTKYQLLKQIGELVSKYEDETYLIAGVLIQPDANNPTEVYQWGGEKFSEEKCAIELKDVEGAAEFYKVKEERIRNRLITKNLIVVTKTAS